MFQDTCVTDEDCEEFPATECRAGPVHPGLDPGTRSVPFSDWRPGDDILKSCWCKEGHMRIPESSGCYDPIRKVRLMQSIMVKTNKAVVAGRHTARRVFR